MPRTPPRSPRAHLRTLCESLLVRSGTVDLYRSLRPHAGVILAYHNVIPDGYDCGGEASLHLERSRFREQLDHLMERYRVVALDALLDRDADPGDRPLAAITFDDAYRGAVELGLQDLLERRLPATFFVPPARIGGSAFWWDVLAGGAASTDVRRRALEELDGDDERIRCWARSRALPMGRVPGLARCATLATLTRAVVHPGVTLAPHGWSHRNLTRLPAAELEAELVRPLVWLRRRFRPVIPWLAYPYGISDARVERACRAAGYRAAVRIGDGTLGRAAADPWALPRVNIPSGLSLEGFVLRTGGLVPG